MASAWMLASVVRGWGWGVLGALRWVGLEGCGGVCEWMDGTEGNDEWGVMGDVCVCGWDIRVCVVGVWCVWWIGSIEIV